MSELDRTAIESPFGLLYGRCMRCRGRIFRWQPHETEVPMGYVTLAGLWHRECAGVAERHRLATGDGAGYVGAVP